MNTSALVLMVVTMTIVTAITAYFFRKVLKTPPKPEPDSYTENDDKKLHWSIKKNQPVLYSIKIL